MHVCHAVATFIISVFIVGMVEMMVAGIMNLMSGDLGVSGSDYWSACDFICINICYLWPHTC